MSIYVRVISAFWLEGREPAAVFYRMCFVLNTLAARRSAVLSVRICCQC